MNPLELVAKTLYSFEEKELTIQLLQAFGKRAETFSQYDDVAKIFFEIKEFSNAIFYAEKALKLAQSPQEKYTIAKNLINAYNQNNFPDKALTQISKIKLSNPQDTELLLEETFSYSAINQKDKAEKLLFNLIKYKLPEEIERKAYHNLSGHIQKLFNYNGFETVCVWDKPEFPKDAQWVYALALPYYLNLKAEDLGRGVYIQPLPEKEKQYEYLQEDKNYKIGTFWNSGSGFEQAHFRSVDADGLFDVLAKTNASLYSLQLPDELPPEQYRDQVKTFDIPDRNFEDTFSLVSQMDLVITSCTSIAHIAAAQGKEVCVFVPIMEYYVWTSSTDKSWWYGDNVHMFKQQQTRKWDKPLKDLEKFLNDRAV